MCLHKHYFLFLHRKGLAYMQKKQQEQKMLPSPRMEVNFLTHFAAHNI